MAMQSLECLTLFRGPPPRSPEQGSHHSPHSKYGPRSGSLGPRSEEGEARRSQELSSFRWKERVRPNYDKERSRSRFMQESIAIKVQL